MPPHKYTNSVPLVLLMSSFNSSFNNYLKYLSARHCSRFQKNTSNQHENFCPWEVHILGKRKRVNNVDS